MEYYTILLINTETKDSTFISGETLKEIIAKLWVLNNDKKACYLLTPLDKDATPIIHDELIFIKEGICFLNKYHGVTNFFIIENKTFKETIKKL